MLVLKKFIKIYLKKKLKILKKIYKYFNILYIMFETFTKHSLKLNAFFF